MGFQRLWHKVGAPLTVPIMCQLAEHLLESSWDVVHWKNSCNVCVSTVELAPQTLFWFCENNLDLILLEKILCLKKWEKTYMSRWDETRSVNLSELNSLLFCEFIHYTFDIKWYNNDFSLFNVWSLLRVDANHID